MGEEWLQLCIWIEAAACFISGFWGALHFFAFPNGVPVLMRALTGFSLLGWIWFVERMLGSGTGPAAGSAVIVMSAALALFWFAARSVPVGGLTGAFVRKQPTRLIQAGAYRIVRHPFYLSYILCWIGTSLATESVTSWIVPVAAAVVYVTIARHEEANFRRSPLAGAYQEYRKYTGMFIPIPAIKVARRDA